MTDIWEGFVLNEDYALKQKLSGYTVNNYSTGVSVPIQTYYRFPDAEEITRTYPHIAIDLTDIELEHDRAHRSAGYPIPYDLEQATPPVGFTLMGDDMPLPWSLIYQLGCYSRNPVHDRFMLQMMYRLFPEEYGFVDMSAFDGTVRRADLLDVVRRDTVDQDNKRLYRFIVTIAVSSEFYLNQVQAIQQVLSIDVDYEFTGSTLVVP